MTQDEMFSLWYSEYPRHEARKDALKAWMKLSPDENLFASIMTALKIQKEFLWHDRESRYIPLAATWIRGERWDDEVPDWRPTGGSNGKSKAQQRSERADQAVREVLEWADAPASGSLLDK